MDADQTDKQEVFSAIAAATIDSTLRDMAEQVYSVNKANGWFDEDRTVGDGCMLIVTEVAEAVEEYRHHRGADTGEWWSYIDRLHGTKHYIRTDNPAYDMYVRKFGPLKPEGLSSELADILVRLLDEAKRQGVNLGYEFRRKLAYNRTRGYRHGGRKL